MDGGIVVGACFHTGSWGVFFFRAEGFGKITPAKAGDRITPRMREKKEKKEVSGTIALCTRLLRVRLLQSRPVLFTNMPSDIVCFIGHFYKVAP